MARFEQNLKTQAAKSRSAACANPTILPVAVHYQGVSNPDRACLVNVAKEAVEVLNADFQAKNSDIVQWDNNAKQFYPNISKGAACLEFQLGSKNHPAGFDLQDGDLSVTINKTTGDQSNAWAGYINIFVGDADGSLGYAPLGGSGNGDGMVIADFAFAIGTSGCGSVKGQSPNDLGRTLTHEMGHYLNLDHVWGDGDCNADDGVTDTPNQAEPNYGCPTLGGTRACSAEALHMNYMDYPDDACMYMFTAGQASRAEAWVNSGLLDNLKTNVLGQETGGEEEDTDTEDDEENTDTEDTDAEDTDEDTNNDEENTDNEDTDTNDEEEDTEDEDEEDFEDEDTEMDEEYEAFGTVEIAITLDEFGSETTFAIEDGDGYEIASFGPFEDDAAGTVILEELELPTGTYTFVIFDEYGDGICCDYGAGDWTLRVDAREVGSSDGAFGYWEEMDFTIGSARLKGPASRKDKKNVQQLQAKYKTNPKVIQK